MKVQLQVMIQCPIPMLAEAIHGRLSAVGLCAMRSPKAESPMRDRAMLLVVDAGRRTLPPEILEQHSGRIVYLGIDPTMHCLLQALQIKAAAILSPAAGGRTIAAVLRAVHLGIAIESPRALLASLPVADGCGPVRTVQLTERQLEVACGLARGKSFQQMAGDLHITADTVSFHAKRIVKITALQDRWRVGKWINQPLPSSVYPSFLRLLDDERCRTAIIRAARPAAPGNPASFPGH
ncbi:MAG TPA: LuxR C-terminal-related transcriptional regulator [Armatimonadota bacterium]|nr:LuxR C-terminal-related transcriptional regulator [Armatimonadota bacterium]